MNLRGLSQVQLAKESGVNQKTISNIVRMETCPSLDIVEKIARSLGVSISDLVATDAEIEGNCDNLINTQLAHEIASMIEIFLSLPEDRRKSLMKVAQVFHDE